MDGKRNDTDKVLKIISKSKKGTVIVWDEAGNSIKAFKPNSRELAQELFLQLKRRDGGV